MVELVLGIAVSVSRVLKVFNTAYNNREFEYQVSPPQLFEPTEFAFTLRNPRSIPYEVPKAGSVIVRQAEFDGVEWIHSSINIDRRKPTYDELRLLKLAVYGENRFAYQVFPEQSKHVNIKENALHLFGRADGKNVLPDFGKYETI